VTPVDQAAEKELREAFKKVSGEDMEVDAYELQGILNAAFQKGTPTYHSLD
jgi:calpain